MAAQSARVAVVDLAVVRQRNRLDPRCDTIPGLRKGGVAMLDGSARRLGSGVAVCAALALALGTGDARPQDGEPQSPEPITVKGLQSPEDAQRLFQLDDGLLGNR